jgi:hypothetical protein
MVPNGLSEGCCDNDGIFPWHRNGIPRHVPQSTALHAWKSLTRAQGPWSMMLLAKKRYSDQGRTVASAGIYAAVAPVCKQWNRAMAGLSVMVL